MTLDDIIKTTVGSIPELRNKVHPYTANILSKPPFAFYMQDGFSQKMTLDGSTGLYSADYQVHIAGKTNATVQKLGELAAGRLEALTGTLHGGISIDYAECRQKMPTIPEREVNLYRRPLSLHLEYRLTN